MYITHDSWRHSDDQLAGRGVCVIAGQDTAGTLEFLQLSVISIDLVLAANPLTVASWHPPPLREKPTLALLPFLSPVS